MELQVWLTSPAFQDSIPQTSWLRGPFVVFHPRTFSRQKTPDEFGVDPAMLEATRPAAEIIAKSANGNSAAR